MGWVYGTIPFLSSINRYPCTLSTLSTLSILLGFHSSISGVDTDCDSANSDINQG